MYSHLGLMRWEGMASSRLSRLRQPRSAAAAKSLRRAMTDAETRLWYRLRACRFEGWKFKRQVPMGRYVVVRKRT